MSDAMEPISGLTSTKLVTAVRRAMVETTKRAEAEELGKDVVELSGETPEDVTANLPMDKYLKILEEMPDERQDKIAEVEARVEAGYSKEEIMEKLLDALEEDL